MTPVRLTRCANCGLQIYSTTARFCRMCWGQLPLVIQKAFKHDDNGVERAVAWLQQYETDAILEDVAKDLAEYKIGPFR